MLAHPLPGEVVGAIIANLIQDTNIPRGDIIISSMADHLAHSHLASLGVACNIAADLFPEVPVVQGVQNTFSANPLSTHSLSVCTHSARASR